MKIKKYFDKSVVFVLKALNWDETEKAFEKIQLVLTLLMQLAFILALVFAFYERQWIVMFVSLAGMFSVWLPIFFARKRDIHIPISFEFLLTLFIYASLFLGEIQGFYTKFWWWDTVLHAGSGIGLGFVGFLIIYSFYQRGPLKSNPLILVLFSFCFALSLGVLWEIFEFAMDSLLGLNMQKSGLVDTMWDLIMDTIGAFLVSAVGYLYLKHNRYGTGIFRYYLTSYLEKNFNKYK